MKKPVVDYTGFRLRRINEPQYAHIKLLLGWVFYFVFYFLTENLIPAERCHVVYCFLDDLVPFREGFVLFYVSWYVLIVISLLYFFLYDIQSFKDLSTFIIITQVVAMAVYILYPTRSLPIRTCLPGAWASSTTLTPPPGSARPCMWLIPWASCRPGSKRRTPALCGRQS